ncbi:MAG: hypothetical protein COB51_06890 [Moraxellaceae bacterium]|nr:MAG: hypothetical protein COB51_06890 [Moraxellaceae bacterium]
MLKTLFNSNIVSVSRSVGRGDFDSAVESCKDALVNNENDLMALSLIVMSYELKGDIDNAFAYAQKALNFWPNDFQMLVLSAKYWHRQKHEKNTYLYVSKSVENPPQNVNLSFMKYLSWLLKPFALLSKRIRHVQESIHEDFVDEDANENEDLEWAKKYKEWYESKYH